MASTALLQILPAHTRSAPRFFAVAGPAEPPAAGRWAAASRLPVDAKINRRMFPPAAPEDGVLIWINGSRYSIREKGFSDFHRVGEPRTSQG
jgi:hypothetical protein